MRCAAMYRAAYRTEMANAEQSSGSDARGCPLSFGANTEFMYLVLSHHTL